MNMPKEIFQLFLSTYVWNPFQHRTLLTGHLAKLIAQDVLLMKFILNPAVDSINLLKPTGYVMHQQFNIQQLCALPTLYLCVLYLPQNKQRLVPPTS